MKITKNNFDIGVMITELIALRIVAAKLQLNGTLEVNNVWLIAADKVVVLLE